jgi:hypothetical protein
MGIDDGPALPHAAGEKSASLHSASRNRRTGSTRTPLSSRRSAPSKPTMIFVSMGASSPSACSGFPSRSPTWPLALTSMATRSPTTKSTSICDRER